MTIQLGKKSLKSVNKLFHLAYKKLYAQFIEIGYIEGLVQD